MNQLNITPGLKPADEADEPVDMAAKPTEDKKPADPPAGTVVRGTPAQRGDIADLDKRLQRMFATLDKNVAERIEASTKANAAAQAQLSARVDALEHSVNSIEGLLRIELGPELQRTLDARLDARRVSVGRPRNAVLVALAALLGGLVAGVVFQAEVTAAIEAAIAAVAEVGSGG